MKKIILPFLAILLITACQKETTPEVLPNQETVKSGTVETRGNAPKINVCHNGNIISISENAWPAHAAHGDTRMDVQGCHACAVVIPLCGAQEVPAVATEGEGTFKYTLNSDGTLNYVLSAKNMNANVTQAHIHRNICGANGPVVAFLFGFVAGGVHVDGEFASGTLTDADLIGPLTGSTIADLCALIQAGNAYINVHTVNHPGGEIRGQLGNPNCNCD